MNIRRFLGTLARHDPRSLAWVTFVQVLATASQGVGLLRTIPERARTRGTCSSNILVVESHLGRFLEPDETIHHKNGVRDNRPENLELWIRPQPTGIRAVDAVAWARRIIARYGDGLTPNNAQTRA
ncbi:MAG: HNH endonuclease [Actinobacteria bacterium]|nr:HNH endonuclease [Actinomycetota bacterium]